MLSKLLKCDPWLGLGHTSHRFPFSLAPPKPMVALESTIITHGLPYPTNLHTAKACEEAIRDAGALPATIALLDGFAYVGLNDRQLHKLAESARPGTRDHSLLVKAGRRELTSVLANPEMIGGTTVSGTMVLAQLAGIDIFATGGIGGVHRGGHESMDISSDLTELGRTPLAVFSSGVKSILDIARTLEYLETQGVGVSTLSTSGEFPAFYTATSGHQVPITPSPQHAAQIIDAARSLGITSGHLFGVPIPSEFELAGQDISRAVEQAVRESENNGVAKSGKAVTPWLLKRVTELCPQALENNTALVVNNAKVAAQTAVELHRIRCDRAVKVYQSTVAPTKASAAVSTEQTEMKANTAGSPSIDEGQPALPLPGVLVIGGAALDVTVQGPSAASTSRTTLPGRVSFSPGGVGRNMAEAATRMLSHQPDCVQLLACIGTDEAGSMLASTMQKSGMRTDGLMRIEEERTSAVVLNLDDAGDLRGGIADTQIHKATRIDFRKPFRDRKKKRVPLVLGIEANLDISGTMDIILADHADVVTWIFAPDQADDNDGEESDPIVVKLYEPTSVAKAPVLLTAWYRSVDFELETLADLQDEAIPALSEEKRASQRGNLEGAFAGWVDFITPNVAELDAMFQEAVALGILRDYEEDNTLDLPDAKVEYQARKMSQITRCAVLVKMGDKGIFCVNGGGDPLNPYKTMATLLPPPITLSKEEAMNTTGAGDTFAGAMLALCHVSAQEDEEPYCWTQELLEHAIQIAQNAAALTIQCDEAVSPRLGEALGSELRNFREAIRADRAYRLEQEPFGQQETTSGGPG